MRKLSFINFLILLFCFTSLNVYGQRKEISEKEFSSPYQKAVEKTGKLSHRIVSERFVFGNDESKIRIADKGLTEFALPDNLRSYLQSVDEFGRKFSFEFIRYEGVVYQRRDEGEWAKKDLMNPPNPVKSIANNDNAKYYLTENVKLDGNNADLFELEIEYKHQTPNPQTKEVFVSITKRKEKRWIGKDSLLLKIEMVDEAINPARTLSRRTQIYQYDPKIKFEAPFVNTKSQ